MTDKQLNQIDPAKFALIAGTILMILPTFFWGGVLLEVFFKIPIIVKNVMLPIDRVSPALTIIIMVGLPLIAIMVNLKSMMHIDILLKHEELEMDVLVKKNIAQWALILYATVSIATILTYAFFENFKIVSTHFN